MYPDTGHALVAMLEDVLWASKAMPRHCWSRAWHLIPDTYLGMREEKEGLCELSHGFMIAALANSLLSVAIGHIPYPVLLNTAVLLWAASLSIWWTDEVDRTDCGYRAGRPDVLFGDKEAAAASVIAFVVLDEDPGASMDRGE